MVATTVHLVRHGEVHNPQGVLYGRLPDFHLSDLGREMAQRVADHLAGTGLHGGETAGGQPRPGGQRRDVAVVIASPLERAQETAAPIAAAFGLEVGTDERLIEAHNHFEGMQFRVRELLNPRHWPHLRNPLRPSWGEPYRDQVARMRAAIADAREQAAGREAVLVSHQLPVWLTHLAARRRHLWHDPRRRQCTLASLTTLEFDDDRLVAVHYGEPAADLLPRAHRGVGA